MRNVQGCSVLNAWQHDNIVKVDKAYLQESNPFFSDITCISVITGGRFKEILWSPICDLFFREKIWFACNQVQRQAWLDQSWHIQLLLLFRRWRWWWAPPKTAGTIFGCVSHSSIGRIVHTFTCPGASFYTKSIPPSWPIWWSRPHQQPVV